jgi:predicted dehydrogenase
VRWGIVGCGDVTEVKSGPGFQKASGSSLQAVTRRDRRKAEDYAARHGVPRVHATAESLIADPDVDAVYIATPPSSHCDLSLAVAAAGKPCLVEKPMALTHAECTRMVDAFRAAGRSLWVAYYRRALSRFQLVRQLVEDGTIGRPTSVHLEGFRPLAAGASAGWRVDPAIAGAGFFFDLASHGFDLVDYLFGPVTHVSGFAANTAGAYPAEDVTAASFALHSGLVGTSIWNFNAGRSDDRLTVIGTLGEVHAPLFADEDVVVTKGEVRTSHHVRNPPHVHQPLIQSIVDELNGNGRCESTGESGARTSWVLEQCVARYYR